MPNENITATQAPGGQKPEIPGLPRPPLFTSDYIAMAEILQFAMERFGRLILALMYYTADGTLPNDLPPDLNMMFAIYQRKIDASREKYANTCKARAESGAKGGKAKAQNAKDKASGVRFVPPTRKQFRDAVDHIVDEGEIPEDISDYAVDSFFDSLHQNAWTIGGKPIQSRAEWEMAIKAKFYSPDWRLPAHYYYVIFRTVFAEFGCGTDSDDITHSFANTYDESSNKWIVDGENFNIMDWKNALARFMKESSEDGKC